MTKLEFWDPSPFIKASDILVAADEPLRALELLDNVPGYYRDNPCEELEDQKRAILAKLATPVFYAKETDTKFESPEDLLHDFKGCLRWELVKEDVEKVFKDKKMAPHIIDIGPGGYWLPIMLRHLKLSFTYTDVGLGERCKDAAHELLKDVYLSEVPRDRPVILFACEIIEHLHYEKDILAEVFRLNTVPDIFHISTPKYTWDPRQKRIEWKLFGDLGHLRTYTPSEFITLTKEMFPSYALQFYDSNVMHMRGFKNG